MTRPYTDVHDHLYWDVVCLAYDHYRDPEAFDRDVLRIADLVEGDGNVERADWLRRLVAGEEVER